jgi:PPM family protein phosphatase
MLPNHTIASPTYVTRSVINKRDTNEDCYQVLALIPSLEKPPLYLLAIADGMGGHAHGEDVSRETLRKLSLTLAEQLTILPSLSLQPNPLEPLQSAIAGAVEQANAHIKRMAQVNHWGTAGSTLVLALLQQDTAWVMNLGDSPLFHWQAASGQLIQVTTNHTLANALQKAGIISPEMAEHHSGRNVLELFVGCEQLPDPLPIQSIVLANSDRLFLCSDGISGTLTLSELEEILKHPAPLSELADNLLEHATAKGATDNQTLILWQHSPVKLDSTRLGTAQIDPDPWLTGPPISSKSLQ